MKKLKYTVIGSCDIHQNSLICSGAIIGKPYRKLLDGSQEETENTLISENTYLGYYSLIGTGSRIGKGTIIDDFCSIESRAYIGENNLITYRAHVCNDTRIGNNNIIGGLISERTIIGDNCRIFGQIVHFQHDPSLEWDDEESMEISPLIGNSVFIGFGATVVGGIVIGEKAYICANSVITKNVPDSHIAFGYNRIIHYSEWKGKLKESPFFR